MFSLCRSDEWRIAELADLAHRAGKDRIAADQFNELGCKTFDAALCIVGWRDASRARGGLLIRGEVVHAALSSYAETFARANPWLDSPRVSVEAGIVWRGDEAASEGELAGSEFDRVWLQPNRLRHWLAGIIDVEGAKSTYIAFVRSEGAPPFSQLDAIRLRRLIPHLRYAPGLAVGPVSSDIFNGNAVLVLEHTMFGVLAFDRNAKVRYASAKAAAILNQQDGLFLRDGQLLAASGADSARLADLIASALADQPYGRSRKAGRAIAIRRQSEAMPYFVRIFPCVFPTVADQPASTGAIGILQDPTDRTELDSDLLAALYDLTPAETRLAQLLSQGVSPALAARDLGVTINTVRTHLKRIFEKTGINRQPELVRLLVACFAVNSTVLTESDRVVVTPRQTEFRVVREQGVG